jgi:hypothetical protein
MPRATYGPRVRARTKQVLELLLRCANQEVELDERLYLRCRWQEETNGQLTLVVQTSLRTIQDISHYLYPNAPLTTAQIREALRRLQDFLGWLEDYRVHQRGTEDWHFALHLPTRNTETLLATAEKQWNALRSDQQNSEETDQTSVNESSTISVYELPGLLRGAPFQAPPLPLYFVDRPEPCKAVKAYLLEHTPQWHGTLVVSAIQGLGGIGKSVLAAALAHDREVQSRFCDGVLWITLGQQPDILSCLSAWIQDLGDHSYKPTTTSSASAHLRTLLHDKRMLLVVDDVWEPSHAEPFRVGGSNCCVLVTTREARIPGCLRYDLDVMTPEQALALLSHAIQEELTETAIQEELALARAVAYLPLALELAAAQIQDGATWKELLEALQQEIADLDILDIQGFGFESQASKQRNLSLLASFNLSLKRLPPEQLKNFAWLGVLPEDITITEQMAATLWDMSPHQARTLLRFFKSRALLLSGGRLADQRLGYRLHDLMHDVARHLLVGSPTPEEPGLLPGLGLTLAEAHRAFLDRYRRKLQDGLWHTVPSDGYIQAHLTWHLEQGELIDEIHQLLQEENTDGENGWYVACRELGQVAGFVNDVARGWRLADELYSASPAKAIGLQVRYALIKGTLNTLASNFPPELIAVLVAEEIWQPAQGLSYLQQAPNPWQQLVSYQALLPYLPDTLLPEAFQVARKIPDKSCRAVALAELSHRIPDLIEEATNLVESIQEEYQKAIALGKLAIHRHDIWPDVFNTIRNVRQERDKGPILRELSPFIPTIYLDEVREIAEEIQDAYPRAIGMAALAQRIPELKQSTVKINLEPVRAISEIYGRTWALAALAVLEPCLWSEVIQNLKSIQHEDALARLIGNLTPYFPEYLLAEVIETANSIHHEYRRCFALGALTARKAELWQQVFKDTQVIRDDETQISALFALAQKNKTILPTAFKAVEEVEYEFEKAVSFFHLLPYKPHLRPKALSVLLSVKDVFDRCLAFESATDEMPELWPYALEAANSIQHAYQHMSRLAKLAPLMPQLWPATIEALSNLWFESQKSRYIYDLVELIPDQCLTDVVSIALSIQDDFERLVALSALSIRQPSLKPDALYLLDALVFQGEQDYHFVVASSALGHREDGWRKVVQAVEAIKNERVKSEAIHVLSLKAPADLLEDFLQILFEFQIGFYQAIPLINLLPRYDLSRTSYSHWCKILQSLAFLNRKAILELIPSLSDSIYALGGEAAIIEVANAIRDVGRQW